MEPKPSSDERLWTALRPLLTRLEALVQEDAAVRAALVELGNALLALAATPPGAPTAPQAQTHTSAQEATPVEATPVEANTPAPSTALDQLSADTVDTSQPRVAPPTVPTPHHEPSDATADAPAAQHAADQPVEPAATPSDEQQPAAMPAHHPAGALPHSYPVQLRPLVSQVDQLAEQSRQPPRAALETIATSCALKADAARWMAERQRLVAQGKPLPPVLAAQKWKLIEHAQSLPECYLWMLHQELPATTAPALYADLGDSYEAGALIAALLDKLVANERQAQPFLIQALGLAAVVQATLRNAIQALEDTIDTDQRKLFQWVEAAHVQYHLRLRRYTKRSKEANPKQAAALIQQVQDLFNKISAQRKRQNAQRRLWRTARTLAEDIQAAPTAVTGPQWQALVESVAALVDAGIPASSVELRKLLLPLLEQLGERLPETGAQHPTFTLVLREVERFLDQEPAETAGTPEIASSAEVLQVRARLQGQSIVFIGGERRLAAEAALRRAFDLKELIWLEGYDQTYTAFEPYVARADVSVVLLALRWSRHGFGQVKEYCDHYDKLFVRLVSGYNPNQVAHVILKQIGERLAQRAS